MEPRGANAKKYSTENTFVVEEMLNAIREKTTTKMLSEGEKQSCDSRENKNKDEEQGKKTRTTKGEAEDVILISPSDYAVAFMPSRPREGWVTLSGYTMTGTSKMNLLKSVCARSF